VVICWVGLVFYSNSVAIEFTFVLNLIDVVFWSIVLFVGFGVICFVISVLFCLAGLLWVCGVCVVLLFDVVDVWVFRNCDGVLCLACLGVLGFWILFRFVCFCEFGFCVG